MVERGVTINYIPFGHIQIDQDVNSSNIEYVLKYICKTDGKAGIGNNDNRIPEFALMSKGLGANFITPQIESFYNKRLDIAYVITNNGVKISMPKYYVNKMMTQETKDDRVGYISRAIAEVEAKDKRTEKQKQSEKIARQALKSNYKKRQ